MFELYEVCGSIRGVDHTVGWSRSANAMLSDQQENDNGKSLYFL